MTRWQRRARLAIAIFAVGFAVVVVFAFKRRAPGPPIPSVVRADPTAIVESSSGRVIRVNRTREDVTVEYEQQLTYKNGSTKLFGVKVVSKERDGGRTFTVTGKEGSVGQNDSTITVEGDVTLLASDGLSARADFVTYVEGDGMVRAPGVVQFSRRGLSGSGMGMTYDKRRDVLAILDQAQVRLGADADGGATDVSAGAATLTRPDKTIRLDRQVKAVRAGQIIEADNSVVYLSGDEERIERVELRSNARITGMMAAPGALESLTGRDMDLTYAADGEMLERVVVTGDAVLLVAGQSGTLGRRISANSLDMTLASDGVTPIALVGRDSVQLTFPADQTTAARTIKAAHLEARGEPGQGLRSARLTGDVDYRERSATVNRVAKAGVLDLGLKAGMSSIEEARFTKNARFAENELFAVAAVARYALESGTLELSGTEPGALRPRVNNERIAVDAERVDVTLEGPRLAATGDVRSRIQPGKSDGPSKTSDAKMPSMLKAGQPVNVVAETLDFDGAASKATYKGKTKLWQADTSIQSETLMIDNKSGDLVASGGAATSTMLKQRDKGKGTSDRVRSLGTANDFKYEEALRRATYTGDAHFTAPQGEMTAAKIELYLQPSGDELERAEAYDKLTLREQNRKTTGSRMTYTTSDETYIVTGFPVTILDQCGRETVGQRLTFTKAADTINVDGNGQIRTQTKGTGKCDASR